jgi:hypothetical protein
VRRLSTEPALLGWYIAEDACKAHGWISLHAQGYNSLKQVDPLHPTFGSINCGSPWLFSDKPSFLPPNGSAATSVVLPPHVQPRTQLSLDVLLLENHGTLAQQMAAGRVAAGAGQQTQAGSSRYGIPFAPIGNCLDSAKLVESSSSYAAGLWMGTLQTEAYISAGWGAVPAVNLSGCNATAAIKRYTVAERRFQPPHLARFGNTRLTVEFIPNATLRGRAWYDADANAAYVAVVQGGGEDAPLHFTAIVRQAFNPRLIFAQMNSTLGPDQAAILELPGAKPSATPPPPSLEG